MAASLERALAYVKEHDARFLDELAAWCGIPSVSSLPAHKADVRRAAEWGADRLRRAGLQNVAILPTAGHPVVYGDWLGAGPGRPTVLVYGHYDVQPALDPSLWESPPFEPQRRGEHLYGRGASDNKGQTMASVAAVEAHLAANRGLGLNVKFLIEGSEEIGSRNLRELIREQRERLACDYCLNTDSSMSSPGQPEIKYALRGNSRMDLTVFGPRTDVHSGHYGGALHNPAQALCELIAGMHDENGRVTLPGFYDRVRPMEPGEHEELARLPRDERDFLEATGAPALWGEPEFTPYERTTVRPTAELVSIEAGVTGGDGMSIVPARARAAFLMRLVPDQDPEECHQSMLRYLEAHAPADIRWEVGYIGGVRASLFDRRGPRVQALRRALEAAWGAPAVFARMGGSIGAVSMLDEEMGVATLLTGFGLPDGNIHGPNERLHLPTWRKGIEAITRFLAEAAAP